MLAKKEAALNSQRDKLIESMLSQKSEDNRLPAGGTSIVTKLTGDSSQLLHQAREKQRELLRERVIEDFHQRRNNQENNRPTSSKQSQAQ